MLICKWYKIVKDDTPKTRAWHLEILAVHLKTLTRQLYVIKISTASTIQVQIRHSLLSLLNKTISQDFIVQGIGVVTK